MAALALPPLFPPFLPPPSSSPSPLCLSSTADSAESPSFIQLSSGGEVAIGVDSSVGVMEESDCRAESLLVTVMTRSGFSARVEDGSGGGGGGDDSSDGDDDDWD